MAKLLICILLLSFGISSSTGVSVLEQDYDVIPAINPSFLEKLAGRLEYEKCYKLCNFLAINTLSPGTSRYLMKCPLVGNSVSTTMFDCNSMLRIWNEEIMMKQTGDMLDRSSYAEDLVEIGLRRSDSPDLSVWVKKEFHQRHHLENVALNQEFAKHVQAGKKEQYQEMVADGKIELTTLTTTETEEEIEDENNRFYLKLIIAVSALAIVTTITITIVAIKRLPSRKPPKEVRPKGDYRFKVYDTDIDETDSDTSIGYSRSAV